MPHNPVVQPLIKTGPVLVAALVLLVQCWLGLSFSPAERVVASASALAHQPLSYAAEPLQVPESLHRLSADRHQGHSTPAISCCESDSQPITLAEIQLIPLLLLFALLLYFDLIRLRGRATPAFSSPYRRLHRLYCRWLN